MRKSCFSEIVRQQHEQINLLGVKAGPFDDADGLLWKTRSGVVVTYDPSWPVIDLRHGAFPEEPSSLSERAEAFEAMQLAPPFRNAWFELAGSPKIGVFVQAFHRSEFPQRRLKFIQTGAALHNFVKDLHTVDNAAAEDEIAWLAGVVKMLEHPWPDAEWLVTTKMFISDSGRSATLTQIMWWIRKDGYCLDWLDYTSSFLNTFHHSRGHADDPRSLSVYNFGLLWPWLAAIDILNSRNVVLVEKPTPPKVAAKRKKAGRPDIVYKTLAVRVKKNDVRFLYPHHEPQAADRRRHHVRGHFKTYTDERPLFGKYTGRFFWAPQWRGLERVGTIYKVYDVQPYIPEEHHA